METLEYTLYDRQGRGHFPDPHNAEKNNAKGLDKAFQKSMKRGDEMMKETGVEQVATRSVVEGFFLPSAFSPSTEQS